MTYGVVWNFGAKRSSKKAREYNGNILFHSTKYPQQIASQCTKSIDNKQQQCEDPAADFWRDQKGEHKGTRSRANATKISFTVSACTFLSSCTRVEEWACKQTRKYSSTRTPPEEQLTERWGFPVTLIAQSRNKSASKEGRKHFNLQRLNFFR